VQRGGWLASGFVAGLVVAGGAFLLLRDEASRAQEQARDEALKAQVDRLEAAVTKLSTLANAARAGITSPLPVAAMSPPAPAAKEKDPDPAQHQAIADADAMVDLGLQSGQWTRTQQEDLGGTIAGLDVEEQGRILARVSMAINAGQLKFDPRR